MLEFLHTSVAHQQQVEKFKGDISQQLPPIGLLCQINPGEKVKYRNHVTGGVYLECLSTSNEPVSLLMDKDVFDYVKYCIENGKLPTGQEIGDWPIRVNAAGGRYQYVFRRTPRGGWNVSNEPPKAENPNFEKYTIALENMPTAPTTDKKINKSVFGTSFAFLSRYFK